MPVSTRSQLTSSSSAQCQTDIQNPSRKIRARFVQEETHLRSPHHGLKEKMKALNLLYEQHKRASLARTSQTLRSEEDANGKEKAQTNSTVTRTYILPPNEDTKENFAADARPSNVDKILGFSCPRKEVEAGNVARKLSMGAGFNAPQSEPRGFGGFRNLQELETLKEKGVLGDHGGGSGSRIQVFVRLRPMAKKEKEAGSRCCVRIVNRRDVYLTEFAAENDYLRLKRLKGRHFAFDSSFPDSTSQHDVYSTTTADLVEAVLQGRNGSVFCYGATGAGKTYTMLGTMDNPGVMVLAIKDLFSKIRQRSYDGNHVVQLSYLEVYNETVRDLLAPGRPLVLREDKQGITASGLTQYRAYSTDEVMSLLQQGNRNRTTEPTRANETSSRSHAILQVLVEYRVRDESNNIVSRVGKLSLIDLAGSERALATDLRTLRSLEGANINRSLLALSSCINALVEGKKHIPYRNSKLTQLLKDSLGGACNTVMIANISPSNLSFGETQNTLHWADRAKEIRTKACDANEELFQVPESETDQAKLLLELQKENRELRAQLAKQQQKLMTLEAQSLAANSSPAPSSATPYASPLPHSAQPADKCRPKASLLPRSCFTPESKKRNAADESTVRQLKKTVKELEAEIEKMKKDHAMQVKHKDDFIRELSRKSMRPAETGKAREKAKRVITRTSLRPREPPGSELKSASHRFLSPAPTAKKRTFWDITTANSPSVTTINGRKTRSHVACDNPAAPSMLLQPGFARPKQAL
uniref:Kinesin-like protein n=1 Tax=Kalanchoe fedtschenkoi TaxID=63787 RepID=A0A7N0V8T9_KALFE